MHESYHGTDIIAGMANPSEDFPSYATLTQAAAWADTRSPPVDGREPAAALTADRPRYVEGALLGRGGMGKVVLARDERIGREVAVKELHTNRPISDEERARFMREARVQGQLEHPSIVPVYDIDRRPKSRSRRQIGVAILQIAVARFRTRPVRRRKRAVRRHNGACRVRQSTNRRHRDAQRLRREPTGSIAPASADTRESSGSTVGPTGHVAALSGDIATRYERAAAQPSTSSRRPSTSLRGSSPQFQKKDTPSFRADTASRDRARFLVE